MKHLGIGIGWRPEIAQAVEGLDGIDWVEAVAENLCPGHLPDSLLRLRERGVTVVPHGVSLGLGGAEPPDAGRLADLAARAEALGSPLVTEHIAFVRAGGALTASPPLEAGHLLPVPRTRDALRVLCENVRIAQDALPVPLALENIAALIDWPDEELTEGQFLAELVERTGVGLLIDVANLHTNRVNRGEDPAKVLDGLPLEAIAYVHVAGGVERDGVWHDTHAHPVPQAVLDVLAELASRVTPPGVLLERDEAFPPAEELAGELDAIRATLRAAKPPVPSPAEPRTPSAPEDAGRSRERLALAQTALLSSLTAGTPAPAGFDGPRLRVQARALAAKRADVVAKVAPELPEILGDGYREAFAAYAKARPMRGGYRQDALDFACFLLDAGRPADAEARRALARWWKERAGARPPGRAARLLRTLTRAA
ncbi:multinuclear nonheme iron-dependent oxidase [Streptomyces violascens]|uniref:multinuclear nonheme iron-dependent oxidase n=1 Tax=Streptomyces violascens TaxID=67381 RepID=UPI0036512A73